MNISPARRVLKEIKSAIFPYGKTRSRNVLKEYNSGRAQKCIKVLCHFNFHHNAGIEMFVKIVHTQVLFLDCGDLLKALQTISSHQGNSCLDLHLSDTSISNLARSILLLKIISSPNFDGSDEEDIKYLWSVWYDICWSNTVSSRFQEDLNQLIDGDIPRNMKLLPERRTCLSSLLVVWKRWFSTIHLNLSNQKFTCEVLKQRY